MTDNLLYRNKDWLEQKYLIEKLTSVEIANLANVKNHRTILKQLHFFSIPIRKQGYGKKDKNVILNNIISKNPIAKETYLSKDWLEKKYLIEKLTTYEIAKLCNLKTHKSICSWLVFFGIPLRLGGTKNGAKLSEEHKKAISVGGLKNPSYGMLGKHHSEESKKLNTLHNIGKHSEAKSDECKEKIKIARSQQKIVKKDTLIEIKIKNFLTKLGILFENHKLIKIPHYYQCDCFVPSKNLVIECDGDYWHNYPNLRDIDLIRNKEMEESGLKVLRLWERDIKKLNIKDFENIINKF